MSDNIRSLILILNQGLNDFKLMNKLRNNFKLAAIVLLNGFFTVGLFLIIGNSFAIVKINKIKQERDNNYYFRPHEKYTVADSFGKFNATYQKNINSLSQYNLNRQSLIDSTGKIITNNIFTLLVITRLKYKEW